MKEYRAYFRKLAAALVALTLVLGCLPMQAPYAAYADGPDGPPSLTAGAADSGLSNAASDPGSGLSDTSDESGAILSSA
ncbi:MAG: hypothetical protein II971_02380, partial [Firmicutes bacterium]|nr:hypothetical protein [Bacillota bacterium]